MKKERAEDTRAYKQLQGSIIPKIESHLSYTHEIGGGLLTAVHRIQKMLRGRSKVLSEQDQSLVEAVVGGSPDSLTQDETTRLRVILNDHQAARAQADQAIEAARKINTAPRLPTLTLAKVSRRRLLKVGALWAGTAATALPTKMFIDAVIAGTQTREKINKIVNDKLPPIPALDVLTTEDLKKQDERKKLRRSMLQGMLQEQKVDDDTKEKNIVGAVFIGMAAIATGAASIYSTTRLIKDIVKPTRFRPD